jgi:hypothetical protein
MLNNTEFTEFSKIDTFATLDHVKVKMYLGKRNEKRVYSIRRLKFSSSGELKGEDENDKDVKEEE